MVFRKKYIRDDRDIFINACPHHSQVDHTSLPLYTIKFKSRSFLLPLTLRLSLSLITALISLSLSGFGL